MSDSTLLQSRFQRLRKRFEDLPDELSEFTLFMLTGPDSRNPSYSGLACEDWDLVIRHPPGPFACLTIPQSLHPSGSAIITWQHMPSSRRIMQTPADPESPFTDGILKPWQRVAEDASRILRHSEPSLFEMCGANAWEVAVFTIGEPSLERFDPAWYLTIAEARKRKRAGDKRDYSELIKEIRSTIMPRDDIGICRLSTDMVEASISRQKRYQWECLVQPLPTISWQPHPAVFTLAE